MCLSLADMMQSETLNLNVNGELDLTPSSLKTGKRPLAGPKSLQSQLGQFMTPATVATFMANMFLGPLPSQVRLLDAGAGRGALTTAFIKRWGTELAGNLEAHAYEFDELMAQALREEFATLECRNHITTTLFVGDFIETAVNMLRLEHQGLRMKFSSPIWC